MITQAGKTLAILTLVCPILLAACGSDESTRVESETHTTTIGQELLDLQRAYERGIITKGEYERTKEDVLRRYRD
jgi:hypothetical protein